MTTMTGHPGMLLLTACTVGNIDVVRETLQRMDADIPLNAAVTRAAAYGHVRLVRMLLGRVNTEFFAKGHALVRAAAGGHAAVVEELLAWRLQGQRMSPDVVTRAMAAAADAGHADIVAQCLANGGDPSADQGMCLCRAARRGQDAVVRLLLNWKPPAGSVSNSVSSSVADDAGYPVTLVVAARAGHLSIVHTLLRWAQRSMDVGCLLTELVPIMFPTRLVNLAIVKAVVDGCPRPCNMNMSAWRPEVRVAFVRARQDTDWDHRRTWITAVVCGSHT